MIHRNTSQLEPEKNYNENNSITDKKRKKINQIQKIDSDENWKIQSLEIEIYARTESSKRLRRARRTLNFVEHVNRRREDWGGTRSELDSGFRWRGGKHANWIEQREGGSPHRWGMGEEPPTTCRERGEGRGSTKRRILSLLQSKLATSFSLLMSYSFQCFNDHIQRWGDGIRFAIRI